MKRNRNLEAAAKKDIFRQRLFFAIKSKKSKGNVTKIVDKKSGYKYNSNNF